MLDNNPQFDIVNQAFPHIGAKIRDYWGQASFVTYMEGLLHGTRGGTRHGFQIDVLMALHNLAEQHKVTYPQFVVSDDFWAYVESKPVTRPSGDF